MKEERERRLRKKTDFRFSLFFFFFEKKTLPMPPSAATKARRDAAAASALAAAATEAGLLRARVANSGNAALALFFECVFLKGNERN